MSTREIVNRYYDLANVGDWDTWSDQFAEDQVMDEQLAGHVEGRETLREMMKGFPAMYASFSNQPKHMVVEDTEAAVLSHISARTHGGESIEADVVNFFRVVDDQIVYMMNVHDTVPFRPITKA